MRIYLSSLNMNSVLGPLLVENHAVAVLALGNTLVVDDDNFLATVAADIINHEFTKLTRSVCSPI